MFVHLHTHSCFSLLEGLPTPHALAQAAAEAGMPALALTDHITLTGAVEFYTACRAAGVQPILGLEIDLAGPGGTSGALTLLAEDLAGWRSLCRLSSAIQLDPEHPGGAWRLERLAAENAGLICLSGGARSLPAHYLRQGQPHPAAALLRQLAEIFPGRLYVELQQHFPGDEALCAALQDLADQAGLPGIATHDVYYLDASQAALQRTLSAIRLNRSLPGLRPEDVAPPEARLFSGEEMERRLARFPRALAAVDEVRQRCRLELPLGQVHFPQAPLPAGMTGARQALRSKAEAGAHRLYQEVTPEIQARLEHELEVIGRLGYEPIFLIMEEILDFARRSGIPSSSRGSAASSLVAHCLGITIPDPIRHNLYFERFLNPARSTPPDIDTDLCSRRRDEVIQHVFQTYGLDRVAMVGTINRFRPRSALGDVAKAHGLSPAEVSQLTRQLPSGFHWMLAARSGGDAAAPFNELLERYVAPRYQAIFADATAILGLPRHLSVHAGGLVIAPGPITDWMPVQRSGSKGVIITQFDLEAVEQTGLVKIDLLGIRGLTVLGDVAGAVHSWQRKQFHSGLDVLEAVPLDDAQTAELVRNGRTIGCFQIESPGMRATLKEIRAGSVEDIIHALALYRPGPLKGGLRDAFVRRHNHQEAVEHIHPALAPLLEETYGVILYQEQVLRIAHELAGMSLADADLLRRAMSHFDPGQVMQQLKERFTQGAGEKSGVPPATAERIWEMMAAFAGYGFPKAHAASYALVAWRSAWCKLNYPAEFMAAVLANWGGYYSQRVYLSEARRLGLGVQPPHVNHSRRQFCAVYPDGEAMLYMGLDQVRDLTQRTQERILRGRPFHSLDDFLSRVDPRPQEAENLVRVGALRGMGSIPGLLRRLAHAPHPAGQLSLFDSPAEEDGPDWSLSEKAAAQEALLGISVETHPLEIYAGQIAAAGAITTVEAAGRNGQNVRVAGVRQVMRRSRTGRGESMAFLTLEDLEGLLDVVIFPAVYRRARADLAANRPLLIEGTIEIDEGSEEPLLRAEKISLLG
ncbi:MAG: DNA polymerase III subunit alpha [Anaerolineaceae bacterium]|nr:DNA polymerase III subunit alpha [Anaerolineaceae bacterium]